jgi:excisionase family DNA binding protein
VPYGQVGSKGRRSPSEPRLVVQEVADAFGVSRELVKPMIRTGQLPSVKLGRRRFITHNEALAIPAALPRAGGVLQIHASNPRSRPGGGMSSDRRPNL